MSSRRGSEGSSRLVWGGVGVLLLLLLGGSFLMAGRARDAAEADAELEAQRYAVELASTDLTPELVQSDIVGSDFRTLNARVQAGLATHENLVRVRIWKPNGDLIFSTEPRDDVEEFVLTNDPQIEAASAGQTVSVVTDETAAPLNGLEGSDEKLFVTYVPLQFPSESEPAGVTEISQRYSAIAEEADRFWRPVQIGLAVALLGLGVLFAISQRSSRSRASSRWGPKPPRVSRDDRKLKDVEDRALAAERAAKEAERRLEESERRLDELTKAEMPPEVRARLDEAELKLRAETAEREQVAAEAKRLRTALSEKEAALALARDGNLSTEAERARSIDAVARAERQAAEAEERAVASGGLVAAAETRAVEAERKVSRLEAQLLDAEHQIADAVANAQSASEKARADDDAKAAADLRSAQLESNDLKLALAEAQSALHDSEAKRTGAEGAIADLERVRADAEAARSELDVTKLDLQRTKLELETSRDESEGSATELMASRAELAAARTELEQATMELEHTRSALESAKTDHEREQAELQQQIGDSEGVRVALAQATADLTGARGELESLGAELAAVRADRDHQRAELERVIEDRERAAQEPAVAVESGPSPEVERLSAELAQAREQLDRTGEELERARAELQAVPPQATGPASGEAADLQARLTRLEAQRRDEIAELQRAQESLANTQLELMDATRKLRTAEDRLEELEAAAGLTAASREPELVYEAPPESSWTPPPGREPEPEAEQRAEQPEEHADDASDEPLSLRERLARAAAARHRTSQPPE